MTLDELREQTAKLRGGREDAPLGWLTSTSNYMWCSVGKSEYESIICGILNRAPFDMATYDYRCHYASDGRLQSEREDVEWLIRTGWLEYNSDRKVVAGHLTKKHLERFE